MASRSTESESDNSDSRNGLAGARPRTRLAHRRDAPCKCAELVDRGRTACSPPVPRRALLPSARPPQANGPASDHTRAPKKHVGAGRSEPRPWAMSSASAGATPGTAARRDPPPAYSPAWTLLSNDEARRGAPRRRLALQLPAREQPRLSPPSSSTESGNTALRRACASRTAGPLMGSLEGSHAEAGCPTKGTGRARAGARLRKAVCPAGGGTASPRRQPHPDR